MRVPGRQVGREIGRALDRGLGSPIGRTAVKAGALASAAVTVASAQVRTAESHMAKSDILSPMDGVVANIDNAQDSSGGLAAEYVLDASTHFTTINMDCGLQVRFIPLTLDAGIVAGTRVSRGQRLGTIARMHERFGVVRWSTHFEIDARHHFHELDQMALSHQLRLLRLLPLILLLLLYQ